MFNGFYITAKGQEYIAKSMAGQALVFTKGKFGNGVLTDSETPQAATDLKSSLGNMPISKKVSDVNNIIVTTQFSNKVNGSVLPAFHFTEAGLYGKMQSYSGVDDSDNPEALLLYAYVPEAQSDYIQAILTEFIINWPMTISASASVTVEIDDSMVYPTLKQYNIDISHKIAAEGTGEALTGTIGLSIQDELQLTVKLPADLADNATLAMNGGTAYPIKGLDGENVKAGPKTGSWLNLIYSETDSCWYMLGGGGSSIEIATTSEAQAGTNDEKVMTPAKTKVYVDKVVGDIGSILDDINGTSV